MHTPFNRLDADLYQLSGEDADAEHVAASGALSVAGLYANHGNEAVYQASPTDSELAFERTTSHRQQLPETAAENDSYSTRFSPVAHEIAQQHQASGLGLPQAEEMLQSALNIPLTGLSASALGALGNLMGSGLGGSGTNGTNGNNGGGSNGQDGQDGSDGTSGHCPPAPSECHGGGDTNITIIDIDTTITNVINNTTIVNAGDTLIENVVNNVTNTVNNVVNTITNLGDTLVDIDIGGDHHTNGNDNDVIDLGIGGTSNIGGNDNDVIDLGLFNTNNVTGNDNDVIDLGIGGTSNIGGNDNDVLDLGLFNTNNVGGNDNDLIDLGLFSSGHTNGSDNDLISLGLNDKSTAVSDNDLIGLDVGLFDEGGQAGNGLIGAGLDLMNDNGLAGIDLNIAGMDVLDLSLEPSNAGLGLSLGIADLQLDTGTLLGQCDEGLLSDDLNIDLGFNDLLSTGADNSLLNALGMNNDAAHLPASHNGGGTVLGLQLGLGAWL